MIHTGLHEAAGLPGPPAKYAPQIPMGRAGQPAEIAEAVLFLLSPASPVTTGAVREVGGGRLPSECCPTDLSDLLSPASVCWDARRRRDHDRTGTLVALVSAG